jgi:hypothetical protein
MPSSLSLLLFGVIVAAVAAAVIAAVAAVIAIVLVAPATAALAAFVIAFAVVTATVFTVDIGLIFDCCVCPRLASSLPPLPPLSLPSSLSSS